MPHFKVIDNVATVPVLNGVPKREARAQALELLDPVGLSRALAERYPSQLSGGQQQRVGVARGLAADPNILLMDEPFGAVDPIVRAELQQELIRLQRDLDKTVVFVTHDIDEAFLLGDQVVDPGEGRADRAGRQPERDPREPGQRLRRELHRRRQGQAGAARQKRTAHGVGARRPGGPHARGYSSKDDDVVTWLLGNIPLVLQLTLESPAAERPRRSSSAS